MFRLSAIKRSVLADPCPACGARPGNPCVGVRSGFPLPNGHFHTARWRYGTAPPRAKDVR